MASRVMTALAVVALAALFPGSGHAQLLSPGRLARAHEALEGIRECTSCHQLGKRGVSAALCLDCHVPLARRIRSESGYHASVPAERCADCHADHLGRDFDLLHLDPNAFDHDDTGYALELSHDGLDCRSCHEPAHITDASVVSFKEGRAALDRTYLGLSAECVGCHREDSPHDGTFGRRGCADCHEPGQWLETRPFDHGDTSFPLRGLHVRVSCAGCHGSGSDPVQLPAAVGACGTCHASPHGSEVRGACADCHDERGWHVLSDAAVRDAFDHARTSFALRGAHAVADCTACHRPGRPPRGELVSMTYRPETSGSAYPRPVADDCAACHVDRHAPPAAAGRWAWCEDCHGQTAWAPSEFDVLRHADARLPLTGAHAVTPCSACHAASGEPPSRFMLSLDAADCGSCHEVDARHRQSYDDLRCETCHSTSDFEAVSFAHETEPMRSCAGCHASDDPHAGQFPDRECSACHDTGSFLEGSFDHRSTRFPLDGAHESAACAACHASETSPEGTFVRYRPLDMECIDCHGGEA